MMSGIARLWDDDQGATAVEYGLIIAAIAMTVIIVVTLIGNKTNNVLVNIAAKIP